MLRWIPLLGLAGCVGANGSAPRLPGGDRYVIAVQLEPRSNAAMTPEDAEQLHELARWMEGDLVLILRKYGYASLHAQPAAAPSRPGQLLLRVGVTGLSDDKPARLSVGIGKGSVGLRTHLELYDERGGLLVGDPEIDNGRDWHNAARQIDLQIADDVNQRMLRLVATEK